MLSISLVTVQFWRLINYDLVLQECRYFQTKFCVSPKSISEYPVYSLCWTHSFIHWFIDQCGASLRGSFCTYGSSNLSPTCMITVNWVKGSVCINRKLCDCLRMTARSRGEEKKQNKYWQILMRVSPSVCDLWARQRSRLSLTLFSYEMGHYLSGQITLLTAH